MKAKGLPQKMCPVLLVKTQLQVLKERFGGMTKEQFAKLPLFPTSHGEAVPKEQMKRFVEDIAKVLQEPLTDAFGRERFGRHTWRGTGTEFLIAMMIALWRVELFGRWAPGSKAVHRYVRTAPLRQSRLLASHALAGGGDWRRRRVGKGPSGWRITT